MVLMPQNPSGLQCMKILWLCREFHFDEVMQTNQPATQLLLHAFTHVCFLNEKKKKKTKYKNKTKPQKTFSPRGNCFFDFQLSEIKLHRKDYHLLPVISINYLVLETFEEYQHPKNSKCCSESIKYFKRKRTNH